MMNEIKTVGIVGAGTMGIGIAQVCALSGYNTFLFDINADLVAKALIQIEKNIEGGVAKGKVTAEQKKEALARLSSVSELAYLKADLIIEAIVEKLEVKQKLFSELEQINNGKAILATNTSSIPITQIATGLKDPSKCVGLHFFNPAHIMKLVEVISGVATSPALIDQMKEFSLSLNKVPVLAKDSPGFIVNRVARHYYVEALQILEENVAGVETIDALIQSSGFKMGPFKLMDLIGVDTNFSVTTSMYNSFHQAPKFRPSRIQEQKVNSGQLGRKTGKGFYDY
ncbi:MAG TPA: 3-hydroxyacyl-CoA dehydrogenase NAD-binding domain-containing protein [Cyclobacteriaceae bacterium]|nr:3-hydroxyacyl-CoA dehydrogenase NAD-binding domain-containing protein [Cyclobacteriaceae bacterium]